MKLVNINIYQLNEKLRNKKIVCFGAGKIFYDFFDKYKQFELEKKVMLILDNDDKKNCTQVNVYNQIINIASVQKFCSEYEVNEFIILITCMDFISIYNQLQEIEQLKEVECCIACYVRSMTNELEEKTRFYPKSFRICEIPRIPKIIHYCWFGHGEIPGQNKMWMDSWKKYCPDYKIIEWNESNYDVMKNAYMLEAYKQKKWGYVSDYARLDVVFEFGGIYLDTDVELIKPLDELLYQNAFVGVEATHLINLGLGFGAVKGCNILKRLIKIYDYVDFDVNNMIAIPKVMRPLFKQMGFIENGEYQQIDGGLTVYPEKVLSGKNNYTGLIMPTENTFAIHHYDGSWNSADKKRQIIENHEMFKILCK